MSKNEEILGSKIRTQCYQTLNDQINRISKINSKLLSDLNGWQKSLEREQKKLRKAKQAYDEKKRQCLSVIKALKLEKEHLNELKGTNNNHSHSNNKVQQIESNIMSLQQKCKHMSAQSREQLEAYIRAVSLYRGFRQKYDSQTSTLLDQLEQCECDRSSTIHKVLKLYLEIEQVMVQQSLRNIDTISKHIANIDAHSDNMLFVEKYKSKQKRPPLPDPKFHPDDEDDGSTVSKDKEMSIENSAQVKFWSEKWRLVVGKILERDIELVSNQEKEKNEKDKEKEDLFAFIQLTDDEYDTLKNKCLQSLSLSHGRTAFSLIINRQRNTEYGLELKKEQFFGLVDLILAFFDSILESDPLDIKPAKLVMIMSQSLYVKKQSVFNDLTDEEKKDYDYDKDDGAKLFIADRIKQHLVWKNEKFWKEAYCDSVQQEIMKYPAVKKWHSEFEQQEAERREEQIIFSQLAAWTHNMKEFGIENNKIIKFLDSRGLKAESVEVLKATLQLNENDHDDEKVNDNNEEEEEEQEEIDENNNNNSNAMTPQSSVGLP